MPVTQQQIPGPELAGAAHPEHKGTHQVERVAVLGDARVADRLHRGLEIAVGVIVVAALLLVLLLYLA